MALNLFKRVETRKGLFAVGEAMLTYNLLTSILMLFLLQEVDHPVQMLIDRVTIADMTFLLMYPYQLTLCRFSIFIRIAIQMPLLSYWYPDAFGFNRTFPNPDHVFTPAKQWVFGGQPAIQFCSRLPQIWVSEPFDMGYSLYRLMILLVMVWHFLYRLELLEKASPVIVAAFSTYYLFYIFVPAVGPQFYFPATDEGYVARGIFPSVGDYFSRNQELLSGPGYERGFFYNLVESSRQMGERPTAAFSSSYVGMSIILMIMTWWGNKRSFTRLLLFCLLLCGATVCIQAHYLIDAIVGFFSAIILYAVATWMFRRWSAQLMFR